MLQNSIGILSDFNFIVQFISDGLDTIEKLMTIFQFK